MAALLTVALVAILAATARILVWPPTDEVSATSADAVVVLAGSGSRLATGQALAEQGVAPVLLVSDGGEDDWAAIERVCEAPADYAVRCLTPDPATTRGEARAVADLADRHALDRLVVVTSAYHLARAELWLRRCTDADVVGVATEQPWSQRLSPARLVHEWAGLARAWLLERAC